MSDLGTTPADRDAVSNGTRPATKADIEILALRAKNRFDVQELSIKGLQAELGEVRSDAAANAAEILRTRDKIHELTNAVTLMELRTAPISFPIATDLARIIDSLKELDDIMRKRDISDMANAEELAFLRGLKLRWDKKERASMEVLIGWRIAAAAGVLTVILFILGYILPHILP